MSYVRSRAHHELFKKDGSSKWWCFLPNPTGGRKLQRPTGHSDEKAAYLWYLEQVRSVGLPARRKDVTLSDALKRRRGERQAAGRAAGTIQCLTVKGKNLERLLGPNTPLAEIDAQAVDDYVSRRLREGAAKKQLGVRSTVYKELVTLRGAIKLARRQGYACNPVDEVMPLDFSPKYKPKERALSELEIDQLLAKLPANRAAVVAMILATGATYPSELVNMRRGDVDKEKWIVRLRGTKRDTRDRFVPIVSFARGWLTQAFAYYPFDRWSNIRRDLHAACDEAGIAHCSPNDLRRSMATLLRARGVEPSLIGTYLGHKDSRMAERVYGRLAPDQLAHLLEQRLKATRPKKSA